jgi:hypothetical protein
MQREGIKQKLKKKESATAKNAPQQKEQTWYCKLQLCSFSFIYFSLLRLSVRIAIVCVQDLVPSLQYCCCLVPPCEVRNGQRGQAQMCLDIIRYLCVRAYVFQSKDAKPCKNIWSILVSLLNYDECCFSRNVLRFELNKVRRPKEGWNILHRAAYGAVGLSMFVTLILGPLLQLAGVASWQVYAITRALRCATSSRPICGLSTPYWARGEMGVKFES